MDSFLFWVTLLMMNVLMRNDGNGLLVWH